MEITAAIEHYRDVHRQEQAAISGSLGELLERAETAGLPKTATGLSLIAQNQVGTTMTLPRLSHYLLERAYGDVSTLVDGRSRPTPVAALDFIEQDILPLTGAVSLSDPREAKLFSTKLVGCISAEEYFDDCLMQINQGLVGSQTTIDVYHDAAGTPLALGKDKSEPTAILLEPLAVEGAIVIASGTIAGVHPTMKALQTGSTNGGSTTFNAYLVEGPLVVRPKRLGPSAYEDPLDRALYAIQPRKDNQDKYNHKRGGIVLRSTIEDFRSAGRQLMQLCELAVPEPIAA